MVHNKAYFSSELHDILLLKEGRFPNTFRSDCIDLYIYKVPKFLRKFSLNYMRESGFF